MAALRRHSVERRLSEAVGYRSGCEGHAVLWLDLEAVLRQVLHFRRAVLPHLGWAEGYSRLQVEVEAHRALRAIYLAQDLLMRAQK